jgi:SAM-dependent methyltransferase
MPIRRLLEVLRDRTHRTDMTEASYWDDRAKTRSGFARSVWHSESFSRVWDMRQQALLQVTLREQLGALTGKKIADVGCGTGRVTRFLASLGADAVGYDFSPKTVEAADAETKEAGLSAEFVVADITSGELPAPEGTFDATMTVGCLAVACKDLASLERALVAMARVTKKGGIVLLLEPIHSTKLLGRVLRAPVAAWTLSGDRAGLALVADKGMGFVPARLALSSVDLPSWMVEPAFAIGEVALDAVPLLERAADYRMLVFRKG